MLHGGCLQASQVHSGQGEQPATAHRPAAANTPQTSAPAREATSAMAPPASSGALYPPAGSDITAAAAAAKPVRPAAAAGSRSADSRAPASPAAGSPEVSTRRAHKLKPTTADAPAAAAAAANSPPGPPVSHEHAVGIKRASAPVAQQQLRRLRRRVAVIPPLIPALTRIPSPSTHGEGDELPEQAQDVQQLRHQDAEFLSAQSDSGPFSMLDNPIHPDTARGDRSGRVTGRVQEATSSKQAKQIQLKQVVAGRTQPAHKRQVASTLPVYMQQLSPAKQAVSSHAPASSVVAATANMHALGDVLAQRRRPSRTATAATQAHVSDHMPPAGMGNSGISAQTAAVSSAAAPSRQTAGTGRPATTTAATTAAGRRAGTQAAAAQHSIRSPGGMLTVSQPPRTKADIIKALRETVPALIAGPAHAVRNAADDPAGSTAVAGSAAVPGSSITAAQGTAGSPGVSNPAALYSKSRSWLLKLASQPTPVVTGLSSLETAAAHARVFSPVKHSPARSTVPAPAGTIATATAGSSGAVSPLRVSAVPRPVASVVGGAPVAAASAGRGAASAEMFDDDAGADAGAVADDDAAADVAMAQSPIEDRSQQAANIPTKLLPSRQTKLLATIPAQPGSRGLPSSSPAHTVIRQQQQQHLVAAAMSPAVPQPTQTARSAQPAAAAAASAPAQPVVPVAHGGIGSDLQQRQMQGMGVRRGLFGAGPATGAAAASQQPAPQVMASGQQGVLGASIDAPGVAGKIVDLPVVAGASRGVIGIGTTPGQQQGNVGATTPALRGSAPSTPVHSQLLLPAGAGATAATATAAVDTSPEKLLSMSGSAKRKLRELEDQLTRLKQQVESANKRQRVMQEELDIKTKMLGDLRRQCGAKDRIIREFEAKEQQHDLEHEELQQRMQLLTSQLAIKDGMIARQQAVIAIKDRLLQDLKVRADEELQGWRQALAEDLAVFD